MSSIARPCNDDRQTSTESSTTVPCARVVQASGPSHIVAATVIALLAGVVLFTTLTQLMVCAALFRVTGFTSHPQYGWVYVSNAFSIMPHLAVMWAFAVVPVLGVLYVVSHCNANANINTCSAFEPRIWGFRIPPSMVSVNQKNSQVISVIVVFCTQVGLFLVIFCDATQHGTAHTIGVCLFLVGVFCLHLRVAVIDDASSSLNGLDSQQHGWFLYVPGFGPVNVCSIDQKLFLLVFGLVFVFGVSFFITYNTPDNQAAHGISCVSEYMLLIIFIVLNALASLRCVRVVYCWHIV